ncbi:hypothetical protein KRR26_29360 [Corallococcus sp. M34]|uniref:Kelch repeat-containing protein n=1 Tax=Citreicoccus inhibens TaxID=2849499 RepID=UPI001C21D186|nr:kelch repeat-containing protein [Citreicoccus inhibens]MBU8899726.1 hypothetical protein [Citreicoccus inhibens]
MSARTLLWLLPASLVASLCACGSREAATDLDLITTACTGTAPLDGVTHLSFRVSGPDMAPREHLGTVRWAPEDVPEVPAGRARVLEVRGYVGSPGAHPVSVALGRSAPFDVPESGTGRVAVRVFLRRVGEFAAANVASNPTGCAVPGTQRAGHTATALPDGRVLVAGGYLDVGDGTTKGLGSAEVFDPHEGTFSPAPDVGVRAFHTATLLPDGRVLLAGGDTGASGIRPSDAGVADAGGPLEGPFDAGSTGVGSPDAGAMDAGTRIVPESLRSAVLLDVAQGTVSALSLGLPRSHHTAAVDAEGHVLFVGGVNTDGSTVGTAEGFDSALGQGFAVPTPMPRADGRLAVLPDGHTLALVGGSEGGQVQALVPTFSFVDGTFAPQGEGVSLKVPRTGAAVAWLGRALSEGPRLLVAGGQVATGQRARTVAASELLDVGDEGFRGVAAGPNLASRANVCAVALPDGRVLVLGGSRPDEDGIMRAVDQADWVQPEADGASVALSLPPLPQPRWKHTCTVLPDGSVLVVGGVDNSQDASRFPVEALVVMPPPRD